MGPSETRTHSRSPTARIQESLTMMSFSEAALGVGADAAVVHDVSFDPRSPIQRGTSVPAGCVVPFSIIYYVCAGKRRCLRACSALQDVRVCCAAVACDGARPDGQPWPLVSPSVLSFEVRLSRIRGSGSCSDKYLCVAYVCFLYALLS